MVEIAFGEEEIRRYSARAGLGFNLVVKEAFLFSVLDVLRDYPFILKGGTAVNKAFLKDKQRFSEDLDFDTELSIREIREILSEEKLKIKKEYYTKHAYGFEVAYTYGKIKDVVKLEFSQKIAGNYSIILLKSEFLPLSLRFKVYNLKELIRQKEKSFINRREWKDLYDLYWIAKLYPKEFSISDKKAFSDALAKIKVPKIANAYIPLKNRVEWKVLVEELRRKLNK